MNKLKIKKYYKFEILDKCNKLHIKSQLKYRQLSKASTNNNTVIYLSFYI